MFAGSISPLGFKELLRVTKPGGIIAWNIATNYREFGGAYDKYDEIVDAHTRDRHWEMVSKEKFPSMYLDTEAYCCIMRKNKM